MSFLKLNISVLEFVRYGVWVIGSSWLGEVTSPVSTSSSASPTSAASASSSSLSTASSPWATMAGEGEFLLSLLSHRRVWLRPYV